MNPIISLNVMNTHFLAGVAGIILFFIVLFIFNKKQSSFVLPLATGLIALIMLASIVNHRHAIRLETQNKNIIHAIKTLNKIAFECESRQSSFRGFLLTEDNTFTSNTQLSDLILKEQLSTFRQLVIDFDISLEANILTAQIDLFTDKINDKLQLVKQNAETFKATGNFSSDLIFLNQQIQASIETNVRYLETELDHSESNRRINNFNTFALSWSAILSGFGLMLVSRSRYRKKLDQFEQLENERNRLVSILEATTDFVSISDLEANITYINRAGQSMIGVEGKNISELDIPDVHPQWASQLIIEEGIPNAIESGSWEGETALLTIDGREIPVSQVILTHRDEQGRLCYLSTIMRDISDLIETKNALQESENRYRLLVEYAPEAIVVFDPFAGHFVDANTNALNFFGFSKDELIKLNPLDISPQTQSNGRTSAEYAEEMIQQTTNGAPSVFEWVHIDSSGNELPCEVRLLSMPSQGGKLIRGSIIDISERKKAERAILSRDNALKTSLNAVVMTDTDGHLTYVNDAFLSLWSYTNEADAIGKPFKSLWTLPETAERVIGSLLKDEKYWRGELTALSNNGTHFIAEISASADQDLHGRAIALMASFLDITQRKRIQLELEQFKTTLDLTQDCVFMFNPQTLKFSYVNKGAENQVGYTQEEMLEMTPLDIKPEFDESKFRIMIAPMLAGKITVHHFETLHRHKDGHDIVVEIALQYVNPAGQPPRFIAIVRDITERKAAEHRLLEREAFYRGVVEASPDSFLQFDLDGRLVQASDGYASLSGFDHEELLGMNIADLETRMNASEIMEFLKCVIHDKHTIYETEHRTKSGTLWSVEVSMIFLAIAGGRFFAFIRDISERKLIENKLLASESALKDAQRLAQIGSWELNLSNNQLTWSDEVFRIFELDPQHFTESYEAFLSTIHPDDRELVDRTYWESVESSSDYSIVHRLLMGDNRIKYVHERGKTFYDQKKPIRSIGTVQDITKAKLAEDELLLYRDRLEALVKQRTVELQSVNQELEAFAYSVSHDLRAPLRAIDGFSQALLEDYAEKLDNIGQNYLGRVRAASQRMGDLIDDLLKLSRITRATMKRYPVNLSRLATSILHQLQETTPDRTLETKVQEGIYAYGDQGLLKVVLENLLSNAWKYSAKQQKPRINFGCLKKEGETVFYVSDNGVGFDTRYADRLFSAFQRLHHREEFEGNGIGLATVKRILNRHGGKIWAESEPNIKTTFFFTLPNEDGK